MEEIKACLHEVLTHIHTILRNINIHFYVNINSNARKAAAGFYYARTKKIYNITSVVYYNIIWYKITAKILKIYQMYCVFQNVTFKMLS